MARSVLAVVAGLATTVVLVMIFQLALSATLGMPPPTPPNTAYLVLDLAADASAAIIGGAVAMRLAPHRPHGHVFSLALVVLVLSLATSLSAPSPGQPAWYEIVASIVAPISVILGGILAGRFETARVRAREIPPFEPPGTP